MHGSNYIFMIQGENEGDAPSEANTARTSDPSFLLEIEQWWNFLGWVNEDPTGNGLIYNG